MTTFEAIALGWALLAVATAIYLLRRPAPYGRHSQPGWGPTLSAPWGWLLMESPSAVLMMVWYWTGAHSALNLAFLCLWQFHYSYRALLYPLRLRNRRPMPIAVCASGFVFNCVNASLNGWWLFHLVPPAGSSWISDPRFVVGSVCFAAGFAVHVWSDRRIDELRKAFPDRYRIPAGGLYRWISCPNYFGELVEWCGWALLTWSPAGALFALWTAANLMPRAILHHRWYRRTFDQYPRARKALIPFLL